MKLLTHIPCLAQKQVFYLPGGFLRLSCFFWIRTTFLPNWKDAGNYRNCSKASNIILTQIASERKELEALKTNPATLEKYAREKYLMKRDNEDLFMIPEKPDNQRIRYFLHNKALPSRLYTGHFILLHGHSILLDI